MTRPSELPDIDVLCYILELLSLKDQLAFSSICQAARTAALISSFSSLRFKIQVGVGNEKKSTACNTLENTTPAFRNSIKEVYTTSHATDDLWPSSVFEVLSSLPNLHTISVGSSLDSIRLSQLVTFFNAVKHAPLRNLSIQIFADVAIPVVAGLPGLETLSIRWADDYYYAFGTTPRVDLNLCDWSTGLIQPSIDTLCDLTLDLSVGKDQEGATLNLELLKPALKLHTFSYTVANTSTDVITQLPKNLPYVKKLSLLWHSWPGEGQPGFNKSFITYFAQLPCLTHLTLCLDLEKEVEDLMEFSHDMAWYNRSLQRRLLASELLQQHCLALERIDWMQLGIDSEGNDMAHRFVVEETPGFGRAVKTVKDWWMADSYKKEHGGPLPDVLVERSDSYFDYNWPCGN